MHLMYVLFSNQNRDSSPLWCTDPGLHLPTQSSAQPVTEENLPRLCKQSPLRSYVDTCTDYVCGNPRSSVSSLSERYVRLKGVSIPPLATFSQHATPSMLLARGARNDRRS
jgi:hypothetical protein